MCCSVLQCVAVCSVLQRNCWVITMKVAIPCCSVLQCVARCCSVMQCVAVCCSVLQGVAAELLGDFDETSICVAACCSGVAA